MKKGYKKWAILPAITVLLATLLTSCSGDLEETPYPLPETMEQVDSGVVMQNDRYALEWDSDYHCVLLRDRQTDTAWGTTPYSCYQSGEYDYTMSAPLLIEYYDPSDATLQSSTASDCVDYETVSSTMGEQGLRCTYYFEDAMITVSLTYMLREDSLKVSFCTEDLEEYGSKRLIRVSVAPYFCCAQSATDKDHYLFVPSGSGALLYTDNNLDNTGREYAGEVYGSDYARKLLDSPADEQAIRLPVFGARNGDAGICAIVEEGDGAASIHAMAGNKALEYANVYASFYVRGFNNTEWDTGKSVNAHELYLDAILLHNEFPAGKTYAVGYYPLADGDVGYSGMASRYRQYLLDTNRLTKNETEQTAYHVNMIGGGRVREFTLGVPHSAFATLTTLEQAKQMIQELQTATASKPQVLLQGFGKSGVDIEQIAGGFAFAKEVGSTKAHKQLESYCQENGISLFTDFDLVRFTKSGNGFGTVLSTATAANDQAATYMPLTVNLRMDDEQSKPIRLLSRTKLTDALNKLQKFTKDRVSGVALSTLGSMAYSDYADEAYMIKDSLREQLLEAKDTLKDHPLLMSDANVYAAEVASGVCDVPLQNGAYDALDETVPFYAMVLRGYVPLYSTALNLSPDRQSELLRAVEAGVSPSFTVSHTVDVSLIGNSSAAFYGIGYEGNKQLIGDVVSQTKSYYEQIQGASITRHVILTDGLTQTVFDNGVTVTVNHSDAPLSCNGQTVPARSFVVG